MTRRSPAVAVGAAAVLVAVAWGLGWALGAPAWAERTVVGVALSGLLGLLVRERVLGAARQDAAVDAERRLTAERASIVQLVSHEFRTPLTVIRGGVETLRAHAPVEPRLEPVLAAVERSVVRLDGMITTLLAAADRFQVDEHERRGTRLETVVDGVVGELGREEARRVQVEVTALAGVETTVERRAIVALLLHTVLDNALKFSPATTVVDVHAHAALDEVVLRVRDRGPGLDPSMVDRAFEAFTQGDASTVRSHPGLGIGLFTARRLATRLGGSISLAPAPGGVGTVAEVRLPRGPVVELPEAGHPAAPRADRLDPVHR